MTVARARAVLVFALLLVCIALSFRLIADGIAQMTDHRQVGTVIPTVYLPPADPGITQLNPQPHLLRDA